MLQSNVLMAAPPPPEPTDAPDERLPDSTPSSIAARFAHANGLVMERRFVDALAAYDVLLEESPDYVEAWSNRGICLQSLLDFDRALASYHEAIKRKPDYPVGYINAGVIYSWTHRYDEAIAIYDKAIACDHQNIGGRLGKAETLRFVGRFDESIAVFDEILKLNPASARGHYGKGLSLLSMGNYREGFREHEWRFGTMAILGPQRFKQPIWRGEKTKKRILVWCEQGLGDSLQFCRYLAMMDGMDVVVEAPKALTELLRQSFRFPVIERTAVEPEGFDLHCPMLSLPAAFGTTAETIPTAPYLKPDRHFLTKLWAARLAHLRRPLIGVSWAAGIRPENAACWAMGMRKSLPRAAAERLVAWPKGSWISLQKEPAPEGTPDRVHDWMPDVKDLADTAALIDCLDLVVSVDSAPAHLAAGMGKPTIVLSRHDVCWRWHAGGVESPWYPTATVLVSDPGDWTRTVDEVHGILRNR